jgi:hypothetical protein
VTLRIKSMNELPPMHRPGAASRYVPDPPKRSKYGNAWCYEDGERFDSKLELRYYRELKLRKAAGEVLWFTRQVPFILEGGVKYRADFLVALASGGTDIVDCKGIFTQSSKNKIKQVKARYGFDVIIWEGKS